MAEQMETRHLRGWRESVGGSVPDDREDRLLPWRSVKDIAGISRTTAWRMQQTGDFPDPVVISANRVGWWESDLTAWKAKRRGMRLQRPAPFPSKGSAGAGSRSALAAPATEPRPLEHLVTETRAAVPETLRPRRRGKPRGVSPDQTDFGF